MRANGVDYAFDLAGTIKAMETAYLVTRWGGTTVTAGLSPIAADFSFKQSGLVSEEKTIKGSYMGSCVPVRDIPRSGIQDFFDIVSTMKERECFHEHTDISTRVKIADVATNQHVQSDSRDGNEPPALHDRDGRDEARVVEERERRLDEPALVRHCQRHPARAVTRHAFRRRGPVERGRHRPTPDGATGAARCSSASG